MEISSGIVFRHIPCFSAAGVDTHSSSSKLSLIPGVTIDAGNRASRKFSGFSSSAFSDNRHLNYLHAIPRCGVKKEKEKEKGSGVITSTKKKMKLLKGLSNDLSMFSEIGSGMDSYTGMDGEVHGKIILEAADVLMRQLEQIRAEEKELKRKKKLEKAQLKATRLRTMLKSESSSSFESSDSKCGEVIQMSGLSKEAFAQPIVHELLAGTQEESASSTLPSSLTQEANTINKQSSFEDCSTSSRNVVNSLVTNASAKRIEVCMGGKCKKSGAAQLLEEFERVIGNEGIVVGCKCMGKCRDGPNVKVLNLNAGVEAVVADDSVRTPTPNPLCIGVGLDDVGVILANFFGEDGGLAPAV